MFLPHLMFAEIPAAADMLWKQAESTVSRRYGRNPAEETVVGRKQKQR